MTDLFGRWEKDKARIAELEAENQQLQNGEREVLGLDRAEYKRRGKRIAELEAENQRLREAAQEMLNAWWDGSIDWEVKAANTLHAALEVSDGQVLHAYETVAESR